MQPTTRKIQTKIIKTLRLVFSVAILSFQGIAQEPQAYEDERYVPETNPLVMQKLEKCKNYTAGIR